MSDRAYTKVFRDEDVLNQMFTLLDDGWTYSELARFFKVDHSSIIYQAQKRSGVGKTGYKNFKYKPKKKPRPPRLINTKLHCPRCELLWKSKFYCDYCKPIKEKLSTVVLDKCNTL